MPAFEKNCSRKILRNGWIDNASIGDVTEISRDKGKSNAKGEADRKSILSNT